MAAVTTGLLVVAVELGFRACVPELEAPPVRLAFANQLAGEAEDFESIFLPSETRFWALRPGARDATGGDEIHAHGMRGTVPYVGRNRRFRIALLGDSCTYGIDVRLENTYGARLAERLAELAPDRAVEVLNAGVPGYTLYQSGVFFEERVAPLEPDLVVLYVGAWNDAGPALGATDRERGELGIDGSTAFERTYRALDFLRSVQWAGGRFAGALRYRGWVRARDAWKRGEPLHGQRVGPKDFRLLLDRLLDGCARVGADVLVVVPEVNVATEAQGLPSRRLLEDYRALLVEAASERGLATLDQRALFPETLHSELFADGVHPSLEGYLWLGRELGSRVAAHPRFADAPRRVDGEPPRVRSWVEDDAGSGTTWRAAFELGPELLGAPFQVEASRRPADRGRPLATDPELGDLVPDASGTLDADGVATVRLPWPPEHPALRGRRAVGFAVRVRAPEGERWSDVAWVTLD